MSADNWGICPRCKMEFDKGQERLKLEAGEAYGKVSPTEYLRLLDVANEAGKQEIEQTFREDYAIGTDADGIFSVSYSGRCSECGAGIQVLPRGRDPDPRIAKVGGKGGKGGKEMKPGDLVKVLGTAEQRRIVRITPACPLRYPLLSLDGACKLPRDG